MQQWVIDESRPDEQFKLDAEILLDQTIQNDLDTIEKLSFKWKQESGGVENSTNIFRSFFINWRYNSQVRNVLVDINSYQDAFFVMEAQTNFEEINLNYEDILNSLNKLAQKRTRIADEQQIETNNRFSSLINNILLISIVIVMGAISITIFTTISITKPFKD